MRIRSIQGIRGVAIFLIVLWHLNSIFPKKLPALGDRGVEFFFIVSGLLIGKKYFKDNKLNNFRECLVYAVRKIKSIYVIYLLTTLSMLLILVKEYLEAKVTITDVIYRTIINLFIMQSWIPDEKVYWSLNGVTWFFSSLVFCYCVTWLIFKLIKRIGNIRVLVALFFVEFVWEMAIFCFCRSQYIYWVYIFPPCRALDFGLGVCLGVGIQTLNKELKLEKNYQNKYSIILSFILVAYICFIVFINKELGYSIYHIFEAFLVWIIVNRPSLVSDYLFQNKHIVSIGNISDTVFFIHLPIITYFDMAWNKLFSTSYKFVEWVLIIVVIFSASYFVKKIKVKHIYGVEDAHL